ncbi:MAG: DedA family protein [Alistipes sp.]|nr:DedA family protein [Alistipes senegalensis]MCM1250867.1 DedA family protein [Alistipes sp.]
MEALTEILADWGYWGLFASALAAGSILPFSSEAVMVLLLGMGAEPLGCLAAASAGNTLGGMTCYWIGMLGRPEWIAKLGIGPRKLARARKFMAGRGAAMGFFGFLPVIGEAIAAMLGLMRADVWLTAGSMLLGKTLRYLVILLSYEGIVSLF